MRSLKKRSPWFLTVSIFCLLCFMSPKAFGTTSVQSTWIPGPTTPPLINGVITAGEWQDAGSAPILVGTTPVGYILVRNDLSHLYMLLDITNDIGNDTVPMQDSFRLTVDVKADKNIEPNVDVQYMMMPFSTNLGIQYYLGPGSYTSLAPTSESQLGVGFSGSPILTSPTHRLWELAISFQEIGITEDIWTSGETPMVRIGIRLISTIPNFNVPVPGNFEIDFADLLTIYLGYPSIPVDPLGPGIKGVGHIPRSNIIPSDGYADTWTEPDPILRVKDASFGSTIDVKGDFAALKAKKAVKYKIVYSKDSGPDQTLTQTWTNYEWDGTTGKYIARAIKPDSNGKYDCLPDPLNDWYWDDLIMRWKTPAFGNGVYTLKLYAYDITDAVIGGGVFFGGTLPIVIDNTPPQVEIKEVYHDKSGSMTTLSECGIVTIDKTTADDGFRFRVKALEDEGHLLHYYMKAHYGKNRPPLVIIPTETYVPTHVNEDGAHLWDGEADLLYPPLSSTPWRPDLTMTGVCGYQFRLSTRPRTIDGYHHIFYRESTSHACIEVK